MTDGFHEAERLYDDNVEEYRDHHDTYQDDTFREDREKFDDQEPFQETDEPYHEEDGVFHEEQGRPEEDRLEFQPEQPKLTPKQRWHRAYNKIVMKLNVSTLFNYNDGCRNRNLCKLIIVFIHRFVSDLIYSFYVAFYFILCFVLFNFSFVSFCLVFIFISLFLFFRLNFLYASKLRKRTELILPNTTKSAAIVK